jgi:hypothetical protein
MGSAKDARAAGDDGIRALEESQQPMRTSKTQIAFNTTNRVENGAAEPLRPALHNNGRFEGVAQSGIAVGQKEILHARVHFKGGCMTAEAGKMRAGVV